MPTEGQMVIANRLRDGFTVFRDADGGWAEAIGDGVLAATTADAAALLAAAEADARANLVVAPYLITVAETAAGRRPREWREAIRAFGPTVETGRNA